MSWVEALQELIWRLVPAYEIELTPQNVLTTLALAGLIHFEYRTWRRHR